MAENVAEAAEALAENRRRQERQNQVAPDLEARYVTPGPGVALEPQLVRADLAVAEAAGILEQTPEDGLDDNFPGGRVEAAPGREAVVQAMRDALVNYVDDPARAAVRVAAFGYSNLSPGTLANPLRARANGPRRPSLEDATQTRWELVQQGLYQVGTGPDGMYGLPRIEGTTPGTRAEIERDREAMRNLEFARRYQAMHGELMAVAGADRQAAVRDIIERGIADGEFNLNEVKVPASAGPPAVAARSFFEVGPAANPENRELSPQYARALNMLLADPAVFTPGELVAAQDIVSREVAPRLRQLVTQGTEAQRTGIEQTRRVREARERLGLHPARQQQLEAVIQRDRDREAGRMTEDQAWDEARRTNSEFRAASDASNNQDPTILARAAAIRVELANPTLVDEDQRRALRQEMTQLATKSLELGGFVMDRPGEERMPTGAAGERRQRNQEMASRPDRFGELDIQQEEDRRRIFINTLMYGGYGDLNPSTFQYEGPFWDGMSRLEREAASPLAREAHQAYLRAAGSADPAVQAAAFEDEMRLLGQAAEAREKAFGEVLRARAQIADTVTKVRTQATERVTEHQEGTFVIGRTTDRELNMELVNEVLQQFNMDPNPSATYRHRGAPPLRSNGMPRRSQRGDVVATDLIYRAPGFPNMAFAVRFNVDGQMVSAEMHVTKDTVLAQAHGLSGFGNNAPINAGSGRFTNKPSRELMGMLDARFKEVRGSVSNPEEADRRAGSNLSLGDNWAKIGTSSESDSYGAGYQVPRSGGLWALETIQAGLVADGLAPEAADRVTHRRVQRPMPGQPRRWWWLRAVSRDFDRDSPLQRRGE